MCFSEQASFSAAAILSISAIYSFYVARHKKEFLALAAIPLFFAFQQAAEGVEWHYFKQQEVDLKELQAAKDLFLLIAYPVWPFWIPFSLWLAEKKPKRKKVMELFLMLGLVLSIYFGWNILFYPTTVSMVGYSLYYETQTNVWAVIPYAVAVIAPWFVSTLKGAQIWGALLFIFSLVAAYAYTFYFASVWCFFAALLSVGVALLCHRNIRG